MPTFTIITNAADTLKTDSKGHTEAAFTVTNTTNRPVRGMATATALDSTKQEWLKLTGEADRDFAAGGTQQYVVTFDSPIATAAPTDAKAAAGAAATPADKYGFRLNVALATNPDEDFAQSPIIRVELPAAKPIVPKKPFPKWIFIPIAAVILIAIGLGLFFALRGKKTVAIPNVVGMTLDDANTALTAANLTPVQKEVQITGKAPAGQVIDQEPKSDAAEVPKGTEVQLITEGEEPKVEVPDVTKRLIDDATTRLKDKGLSVVVTSTDLAEGLQPNQVVSQQPAGGAQVKQASTVELVIAVQRQIAVPDVTFRPANLAQQQISAAGLKFVMKDPEMAAANVAPGNIKSQNPGAGEKVPPGATVELVAAAQPTTVPNVQGKRIAEAQILFQQAGLELGRVSGTVNENNASVVTITGQNPGGNTQAAKGSKIDVSVPQLCGPFARCLTFVEGIQFQKMDTGIRQKMMVRP
jgi:serine/threonine-protein kinase